MSDEIFAPAVVPEGTYGAATTAINKILRIGHDAKICPVVTSVTRAEVEILAQHFSLFERATGTPAPRHPMFVLGDAVTLNQLRDRMGVAGDSVLQVDRWSELLARCVDTAATSSPEKRGLFGPPLWPFHGLRTVVKKLSIGAPKDVLDGVTREDREVFWQLACDMEMKFWAALDWEIIHGDNLSTNPFFPLLQLVSHGLYALGFEGPTFVVFGRASPLMEPSYDA